MRQNSRQKESELTNEKLSSIFSNNFQLAITAIKLAQNEILAGHEVTMQSALSYLKQNPHLYSVEESEPSKPSEPQE